MFDDAGTTMLAFNAVRTALNSSAGRQALASEFIREVRSSTIRLTPAWYWFMRSPLICWLRKGMRFRGVFRIEPGRSITNRKGASTVCN